MVAIDYQLELLETALEAGQPAAWPSWDTAFRLAHAGWHFERAQQLLGVAKRYVRTDEQHSAVRYAEGLLFDQRGEWPAAEQSYEHALVLKQRVGEPRGIVIVLNALAAVLRRQGQSLQRVIAMYDQALHLAVDIQDDEARISILNGLGLVYTTQGALAEARTCYTAVRALVQSMQRPALEAVVLHNLGAVAWTQGQLEEAEAALEESLVLQRAHASTREQAETQNSLGLIKEARGDWVGATACYEESLSALRLDRDLYGQVQVLVNLGNVVWLLQQHEQARTYHEQALALAEDLGDLALQGQALTGLGDTYHSMGLYAQAEEAFVEAVWRKDEAGDERSLKHTYLSLGALYQKQRRVPEARHRYEQTLAAARSQGDARIEATTLLNLARLAFGQEDLDEAQAYAVEAEGIARQHDYYECLAHAWRIQGDVELFGQNPDSAHLLRSYVRACAYASDFNEITLNEILQHLAGIWTAQAEDGYKEQSCWFCDGVIKLWEAMGYTQTRPQVPAFFHQLRHMYGC